MDTAKLNDWMQVVGIFALVASLIFVGLQLNQEREIAEFEGADAASNRVLTFRALLAENSDTWRKGCLGENLDAKEESAFASLYAAYEYYEYTNWLRLSSSDLTTFEPSLGAEAVVRRMAKNFHQFPGLLEAYDSRRQWRERTADGNLFLETLVLNAVAELKKRDPEPVPDARWCGH